jgi:putative intracellular protease/amidase
MHRLRRPRGDAPGLRPRREVAKMSFRIVIPVYPGVTHLDFTGPHQVFVRMPDAAVTVASVGGRDVSADGLVFSRLADLATIEACDLICVPGGLGTVAAMQDEAFMGEVRRLAAGARYVTSVCTGSLILGAAGLLKGKRAACHWAWRDLLPLFGAIIDEGRVVRDGNVFTGGGVTAGIDLALTVIGEACGADAARAVQLTIEYAPAPPFDAGRPETAPPELVARMLAGMQGLAAERRAGAEAAAARIAG